jgi:hypothetical protein
MSASKSGSVSWVDAKESLQIYVGHDPELDPEPDPHVFKSPIRIRSKIVRIRNTASKFVLGAGFGAA